MTDAEVRSILLKAKYATKELLALSMDNDTTLDVSQRLTASYGSQRVSGGRLYENPTLTAMIRRERRDTANTLRKAALEKDIRAAKELINVVDDKKLRMLLSMYYIEDKTERNICRFFGWKSAETFQRKMRSALDRIIVNK